MSTLKEVLRNFKAIQDSGPLRLTPLTVFVGNNGSGKSSVIEGLEMLQTIVEDGLDQALRRWRDIDHIWNMARPHVVKYPRLSKNRVHRLRPYYDNGMEFSLKGHSRGASWSADLEINQEPGGNAIYIRHETLRWRMRQHFDRDASGYATSTGKDGVEIRTFKYADGESGFGRDFTTFAGDWQFLSLNPDVMGSPTPQRRTGGRIRLARDGSNVAEYLLEILQLDLAAFEGILTALQYVLPYARDIQSAITQEIERAVYLRFAQSLESAGVRMDLVFLVCVEAMLEAWLIADERALEALLRRPTHPARKSFVALDLFSGERSCARSNCSTSVRWTRREVAALQANRGGRTSASRRRPEPAQAAPAGSLSEISIKGGIYGKARHRLAVRPYRYRRIRGTTSC